MRQQLINLRQKMQQNQIDAYLIPTTDYHGSEYVNDYFKCRKYIRLLRIRRNPDHHHG